MASKDKTVTEMVDAIAKLRGTKRDETRDYMLKVAYGRLLALLTWRKSADKKPSKKGGKKASKRPSKKASKPKVQKIGTSGNNRAAASKVPALAAVAS